MGFEKCILKQLPYVKWVDCFSITEQGKKLYFVLVDAPYPDDGVPPCSEEPVQSRVELECIHPVSIVLLHLISNDIWYLEHREENGRWAQTPNLDLFCFGPHNTPTQHTHPLSSNALTLV